MSKKSLGNILLDKDILLESGTNELEVLVFSIGERSYGINVAKVREVLPKATITRLAKAHPSVRGVFKLRDVVIPCVSLVEHLKLESDHPNSEETLILSDFNRQQTAFLVDEVERIHRISWENVMPVPPVLEYSNTPVTAVAKINDRMIMMLDFETILDEVTEKSQEVSIVENPHDLPRNSLRVLVADDSPTVRQAMERTLQASGYTNLFVFENGKLAWDWLVEQAANARKATDVIDIIISDVEMPQIDGFHLTKKVKEHPLLNTTPVLLYSSIVTPDNHKKGVAVGADEQISKPELGRVVGIADDLILKRRESFQATELEENQSAPEETQGNRVSSTQASKESNRSIPSGSLWETFRAELGTHVEKLQELQEIKDSRERIHAALRILHTIKSSAMVVPQEEITRATHAVEEVLSQARDSKQEFPHKQVEAYFDWIDRVALSKDKRLLEELSKADAIIQQLSQESVPVGVYCPSQN